MPVESPDVELLIGPTRIAARLEEMTESSFDIRARVLVDPEDVARATPDLASAVILRFLDAPPFRGFVMDLRPAEGQSGLWRMETAQFGHWEDRLAGGLKVLPGTERIEIMFQIFATNGEALTVHGWNPKPASFAVIAPVEGAAGISTIETGAVEINSSEEVLGLLQDFADSELCGPFSEPKAWALPRVIAATIHGAETEGIARIRAVVDRLALASRYSLSVDPDGSNRTYRRSHLGASVLRVRPVVATFVPSGRRGWLRGLEYSVRSVTPNVAEVLEGMGAALGAEVVGMNEAINAWRRGIDASDDVTAVVALAEAMEWYVRGVELPPAIPQRKAKWIRRQAVKGLDSIERRAVLKALEELDRSQYRDRVLRRMADDQVPHTEADITRLDQLRKCRNSILHGKALVVPTRSELQTIQALINRLLVYRLHRARARVSP